MLSLHLAACTTWRASAIDPRRLVEVERPEAVRVTRPDGQRVVVEAPVVRADSIRTGKPCERTFADGRAPCDEPTPVIPLDEIDHLEVRHSNGPATFAAVVVGGAALIYGFLWFAFSFSPD